MFGKKKEATIETGVIQAWDDDTSTGVDYWDCYYKGVCFGHFDNLSEAHQRLQDLLGLDEFYKDRKLKATERKTYTSSRSPVLNKMREDELNNPTLPAKKKED